MRRYGEVMLWGLVISALGTLPLGTLNVTAMQVAISDGLPKAFQFSLGVVLVEVAYVRLSLVGIHWLRQHGALLRWMDWIACLIVFALAVGSFIAAMNPSVSKSFILTTNLPLFVLGVAMSALNPVQLPFWLGWSSFLFSKKVLHAYAGYYNWYTAGIGIGTMAGLAVFVYGGRFLVDILNTKQVFINYIIGTIFLITAGIQLYKIAKHKGLAENTEEKGAELEMAEETAD
jgi:threonine/homoserine/homoserine lactone efflux protein